MVRSAIPIIVVIVATAPFQARQEVPRFSGAWELVPDQSQADGEGASFAVAQSSTAATGLVAGTVLDALSGAAVSGAIVRIHRTEERMDITGATLQAFSITPLPGASSVTTGKDASNSASCQEERSMSGFSTVSTFLVGTDKGDLTRHA
jgi:hypothetical protein